MHTSNEDTFFKKGIQALQAGKHGDAKAQFDAAVHEGIDSARIWLGLALANLATGDTDDAESAIDATLRLEPNNLRALVIKGDILFSDHRQQAAAGHYGLALRLAAAVSNPSPAMQNDMRRIASRQQHLMQLFQQHLMDQLHNAGYRRTAASDRFNAALDMLLGKMERPHETRQFPQAPHTFYMPDIPYRTFFPEQELSWINQLEDATDTIEAELRAVLEQQSEQFTPYVHSGIDRPQESETALLDSEDWTSAYLWEDGRAVPEVQATCPRTMDILKNLPLTRIGGMAPSVLFSKLDAGAAIEPHTGLINTRLICHLPLITPPDCGLRVGSDTRETVRGKAWAFDDSISHEAWNRSDAPRTILLFDVWRPELDEAERHHIQTLLEAVSSYSMNSA